MRTSPTPLVALVVLPAALLLGGCSAKQTILDETQNIEAQARGIQADLDRVEGELEEGSPAGPFVRRAQARAQKIQESTQRIQGAMPGVENKTPWWVTLALRVSLVVLVLALLAGAWYLGLGRVARRVTGWLTRMVPRPHPTRAQQKQRRNRTQRGSGPQSGNSRKRSR